MSDITALAIAAMDVRRGAPTQSAGELELPEVQRELTCLCASSAALASVSGSQSGREKEIQELCNSVWTVQQQQYSVSGKCGDQQQYTVAHQYTQQVATIDKPKFEALKESMTTHLNFSTSALASALFEHSLCELRLLLVLQKQVFAPERKPASSAILKLLKMIIARLSSSEAQIDARTLPFLRKLALLLGSRLLASAQEPGASINLLDGPHAGDVDGSGATPLVGSLLQLFYVGKGCGWAAPLLQPTVQDLVEARWLWHTLVNQPAEVGALPAEPDLLAFLSQVEWRQLDALAVKDVEAYVVQPINRMLRRVCEANQVGTLLLLGKLLTAAVCAHPSLCHAGLTTLTRSTVRAALLCAPFLALWPWQQLGPEALWTAWCEMYRVVATRIEDFAQRHPLQQHSQQKEFLAFQLAHPHAVSR